MLAWVPQAHQDPRGGGGQGVALAGSRSMGSVGEGGTKAQEWASPPQCGTEGMEGWDMSVHTGVRWGSWRLSHRPQEGGRRCRSIRKLWHPSSGTAQLVAV